MTKKYTIFCVAFSSLAILGLCLHKNLITVPFFSRSSEAIYLNGISDDRVFVGASHNIFVGKILEKIGQKQGETGAMTQFEIQVIENIKGSLIGNVIMNQEGGFENGILTLVDNQALLAVGSTYLLSARTDGKGTYLISSYPRGHILISADGSLSFEQLGNVAIQNNDVKALRNAYTQEIPLDVDVKNHFDFNRYDSLEK